MTAQQKSALRVGVLTTVLAGLFLMAFSKVAGQVVLRPEFEALELRVDHKLDRILDAVCVDKPSARPCQ